MKEDAAVLDIKVVGVLEVCNGDSFFWIFEMGDIDVGEEFQFVLRWFCEFFFKFAMFFGDGLHFLLDLSTAMLLDFDFIIDLLVLMLEHSYLFHQSLFLTLSCFLLLCNGGLNGSDLALSHGSCLFELL